VWWYTSIIPALEEAVRIPVCDQFWSKAEDPIYKKIINTKRLGIYLK
jgi:hypothetical protein